MINDNDVECLSLNPNWFTISRDVLLGKILVHYNVNNLSEEFGKNW